MITDIHRSSVVDGPGIRTTIFLKGCPLSCLWCHNPETQAAAAELALNPGKCIGCGACVPGCPQAALQVVDGSVVLDRARCDGCLSCVDACPTEALFTYGRIVTVDELLPEILKDRLYYQDSGGGVTISGGEPMQQPRFTMELLKRCREEGLHTCLDTTGIGPAEAYLDSLPYVDLYLFDYKASDPELHRHLTGVSLPGVMKTFELLLSNNARVRLRCPLIPGVNDDETHLKRIAEISRSYPELDGVDLLCWHTMGVAKYTYLDQRVAKCLPTETTGEDIKAGYRRVMKQEKAKNVRLPF